MTSKMKKQVPSKAQSCVSRAVNSMADEMHRAVDLKLMSTLEAAHLDNLDDITVKPAMTRTAEIVQPLSSLLV